MKNIFSQIIAILVLVLIVIFACTRIFSKCSDDIITEIKKAYEVAFMDTGEVIKVEADSIYSISLAETADLYVLSQEIQDYKVMKKETGIFNFEHTLVLIENQKCNYKIPMSEVKYIVSQSDTTVYAFIPDPVYVASNHGEEDVTDDEGAWRDTPREQLREQVKEQIRNRFCTAENRRKAKAVASKEITLMLKQIVGNDYKVVPVCRIEQVRE